MERNICSLFIYFQKYNIILNILSLVYFYKDLKDNIVTNEIQ